MKKVGSAEEIRAELQRRISQSTWATGYCADCTAPMPYRITHDGVANWTAQVGAAGKPGCESLLFEVIASVRAEYDLSPETLPDVVRHLLSWRSGSEGT
jgi:hypothetical protein